METTTRMGSRSSSRHGPAVQFSGRVRKWQKTWTKSGTSDQLQMFKWLPVSGDRDEEPEDLPPRKYRFLPFDVVHGEVHVEKEPSPIVEVPGTASADVDVEILEAGPVDAAADVHQTEALDSEAAGPAEELGPEDDAAAEQPESRNPDSAQLATEAETGANTALPVGTAGDQEVGDSVKDPAGEENEAAGVDDDEGDVQIREALESLGEENGRLEAEAGKDNDVDPVVKSTDDGSLAGRSMAGEIAESLVATGLVEEGDAAKVEARALAKVVSEEARTNEAAGRAEDESRGEEGEAGLEGVVTGEKMGEESAQEPGVVAGEKKGSGDGQDVNLSKADGGGLEMEKVGVTALVPKAPSPENETNMKEPKRDDKAEV